MFTVVIVKCFHNEPNYDFYKMINIMSIQRWVNVLEFINHICCVARILK